MTSTINIPDFPGIPAVFSHATKLPATASLVYCSGQIPALWDKEKETQVLFEGTVSQKTELVINGLEKVLKEGGSSLDQLVKVNIYITSFDIFQEMNTTYAMMIPTPKPARTCVCVRDLPFGAVMEIEAIGWASN